MNQIYTIMKTPEHWHTSCDPCCKVPSPQSPFAMMDQHTQTISTNIGSVGSTVQSWERWQTDRHTHTHSHRRTGRILLPRPQTLEVKTIYVKRTSPWITGNLPISDGQNLAYARKSPLYNVIIKDLYFRFINPPLATNEVKISLYPPPPPPRMGPILLPRQSFDLTKFHWT